MNQLKPVIIVLLMLTSALAGCAGDDTAALEQQIADLQQSNNQMNETIYYMEITLQERNNEIAILNSNMGSIADAETYRDSLLVLLENSNTSNDELESMIEAANNSILTLQSQLVIQQDLVVQWQQTAEYNRADLSGAYLRYVDLSYANLRNANLSNADLIGAYLVYADLTGAELTNVDLRNADLTGAEMSGVFSLGVIYWGNTICPDGANSDNNGNTCENNL